MTITQLKVLYEYNATYLCDFDRCNGKNLERNERDRL